MLHYLNQAAIWQVRRVDERGVVVARREYPDAKVGDYIGSPVNHWAHRYHIPMELSHCFLGEEIRPIAEDAEGDRGYLPHEVLAHHYHGLTYFVDKHGNLRDAKDSKGHLLRPEVVAALEMTMDYIGLPSNIAEAIEMQGVK